MPLGRLFLPHVPDSREKLLIIIAVTTSIGGILDNRTVLKRSRQFTTKWVRKLSCQARARRGIIRKESRTLVKHMPPALIL